uniref:Uncharacterized protein n=1 Tax=Saimiri boliviensis boliviensis TaxID=39432 RepID=A0A2K6V1I7_SAIBB
MFTMLCINGTTPRPLPVPFPFGSVPPSGLAGGSAHPPLGYLPLPLLWCPFPLPCARCSVVYISSPRHGAHAPRDMILSLVLAHGALYKELGVRGRRREPS